MQVLTAQGAAGNRRRGRGCRRRPRPGRARLWRSRLGRRRGPRRNCYLLRGIVCGFFSLVQPVTLTGAEAIVLVLHNRNCLFACCHFGSSIDAASANYKSGRHSASAMGKRAGQAPVSKRAAAKMCSQPRASSGVGANNGSVEDAQGRCGAGCLGSRA